MQSEQTELKVGLEISVEKEADSGQKLTEELRSTDILPVKLQALCITPFNIAVCGWHSPQSYPVRTGINSFKEQLSTNVLLRREWQKVDYPPSSSCLTWLPPWPWLLIPFTVVAFKGKCSLGRSLNVQLIARLSGKVYFSP